MTVRLFLLPLLLLAIDARAQIGMTFPTSNDRLYYGDSAGFFHGTTHRADPWRLGTYGWVRNPSRVEGQKVHTRMHEGVDIKALYRDRRGMSLDTIRAAADGRVVHAMKRAGGSNYGKYVVIEHEWDGSSYYTLYSHLHDVWIDSGAVVKQGEMLGQMGYTGTVQSPLKAHLHFEINILLNSNFQRWYDSVLSPGSPNFNGIYSGINLSGIDPAGFLLAIRSEPKLSLPGFVRRINPTFRIRLPRRGELDIVQRYPWLLERRARSSDSAWEIDFSISSLPLRVTPVPTTCTEPQLVWVSDTTIPPAYISKRVLGGTIGHATISKQGMDFLILLAMNDKLGPEGWSGTGARSEGGGARKGEDDE